MSERALPPWVADVRAHPRAWWAGGTDARTGRAVRWSWPDTQLGNDPPPEWRRIVGEVVTFPLFYDRRAEIRRRQAAELAPTLRSDVFLPVLAIEPVVIVETPPATPSDLDAPEALEALLQLLEALAELHAAGWAHRCVLPEHVGVARDARGVRVRVAFPSVGPGVPPDVYEAAKTLGPVRADVLYAANLAAVWVGGGHGGSKAAVRGLERALGAIESAADLARVIAPHARDATRWKERAAAMPDVRELRPVPTDWDRVIDSLERDLVAPPEPRMSAYASLCARPARPARPRTSRPRRRT